VKHIRKMGAPHAYRLWLARVHGTNDADYRRLRNPLKSLVHESLLREQGWLCAYTMKRITADCSHIEHIKPESVCRDECPGSDLDYGNFLACFPRENAKGAPRYGEPCKGGWWKDNGKFFLSPLNRRCQMRFRFDIEGRISVVGDCAAATETMRLLRLHHLCPDLIHR
jgi:uncharacterized protein (TIGR02646 family)